MEPLSVWLNGHRDKVIAGTVERLSTRDELRRGAEEPIRDFFDGLLLSLDRKHEALESVLRGWVVTRHGALAPDACPVGLLPVLGAFKQAVWSEFQADPPAADALSLAAQFDSIVDDAAVILSKMEAAALMDELSHQLVAGVETHAADDAKESFVSVAAHELKTPLTVIEGYTNMLKMDIAASAAAAPRLGVMVQGIESGITRLRDLIEDLIDVSLIEMSLMGLEVQPVWLRRLFDIAEFELATALRQRTLTLEINRDSLPSRPMLADAERLLQAFHKILMNAVKYTPDGGRITVSGQEREGFVEITVADTGIGIEQDYLERIFDKFAIHGDITRHSSGKIKFKGGGAGLGLAIARGIVEAHGGTIWAESPGLDETRFPGSRFHIMLPMRDVRTAEGSAPLLVSTPEKAVNPHIPSEAKSGDAVKEATHTDEKLAGGEVRTGPAVTAEATRPGRPPLAEILLKQTQQSPIEEQKLAGAPSTDSDQVLNNDKMDES